MPENPGGYRVETDEDHVQRIRSIGLKAVNRSRVHFRRLERTGPRPEESDAAGSYWRAMLLKTDLWPIWNLLLRDFKRRLYAPRKR